MITAATYRNAKASTVYPFISCPVDFDLSLVRKLQISVPNAIKAGLPVAVVFGSSDTCDLIVSVIATQASSVGVPQLLGTFMYTNQLVMSLQSDCGVSGILILNHAPIANTKYTTDKLQLLPQCVVVEQCVGTIKDIHMTNICTWIPGLYSDQYIDDSKTAPQCVYQIKDNTLKIHTKGLLQSVVQNGSVRIQRVRQSSNRLNRTTVTQKPNVSSILGVSCDKLLFKTQPDSPVVLSVAVSDNNAQMVTIRISGGTGFPGCGR